MVDQWKERTEVKSMSDGTKTYIIARRKSDDTMACSCPHWKFHKAPKIHCKHIIAFLEAMAQVIQRSRIFLDSDFSVARYIAMNTMPSRKQVEQVMGRSTSEMLVSVKGEQFQVKRIFLE